MNIKQLREVLEKIEDQDTEVLIWSHIHQHYIPLNFAELKPVKSTYQDRYISWPNQDPNWEPKKIILSSY